MISISLHDSDDDSESVGDNTVLEREQMTSNAEKEKSEKKDHLVFA